MTKSPNHDERARDSLDRAAPPRRKRRDRGRLRAFLGRMKGSYTRSAQFKQRITWKLIGAGVVGVAAVVGPIIGFLEWQEIGKPEKSKSLHVAEREAAPTPPDASGGSDSGSSGTPSVADEKGRVGTCLSDPVDVHSIVACDIPHSAEIIGGSEVACDEGTVVVYMGGSATSDVLSRVVQLNSINGFCVAHVGEEKIAVIMRDALQSSVGDALRECFNSSTEQFVPCAHDHTGEVVARVPSDSPHSLTCETEASEYLERDFSALYQDLLVETTQAEDVRRCVVNFRANQAWLRTPLRGIGNGKVETEPM